VLPGSPAQDAAVWVAATDFRDDAAVSWRCRVVSGDGLAIDLNGTRVHEHPAAGAAPTETSFDLEMAAGLNRLVVTATGSGETSPRFQLELRRRGSTAVHEELTRLGLSQPGDAANGRRLFLDAAKTQCIKCHWMEDRGERIGPDLTGIGNRFSRIHLIESVLQPSHSIANGYQTVSLALTDGRVLSGVLLPATGEDLTLADSKGEKHVIRPDEIEARRVQETSTMPEGLEKPLTPAEFVDLIAFLVSCRSSP
jgi:putative heme-binding domain-containing protein